MDDDRPPVLRALVVTKRDRRARSSQERRNGMQIIRTRKRLMAAAAVAAAALTAASLAGMGAAGAATNLGHRPHPHYAGANVTGTVHFVNDQFQGNIGGFCGASPPNAPCDGNAGAGDYGTIDSVSSKFSNGGFGNYAPSTKSLDGS